MKTTQKTVLTVTILGALALGGCATLPPGLNASPAFSPRTLTPRNAQQVQRVRTGTIIGLVPIMIKSSTQEKREGSGLGALVGGLIGHNIGGGRGKELATIAGVIGGGIGGNVAAQHAYEVPGEQVTIRLTGGRLIAVTQAIPHIPLYVHERVEIVGGGWSGSAARVLPLAAARHSPGALH